MGGEREECKRKARSEFFDSPFAIYWRKASMKVNDVDTEMRRPIIESGVDPRRSGSNGLRDRSRDRYQQTVGGGEVPMGMMSRSSVVLHGWR